MFATPGGLSQRRPAATRRLFGRNETDRTAAGAESDHESPLAPENGAERVARDDESGEMLRILRNLQQQVSSMQAQQAAQAAAPPTSVSPAASNSSSSSSPVEKKLPKDLTVSLTSNECGTCLLFIVFSAANC